MDQKKPNPFDILDPLSMNRPATSTKKKDTASNFEYNLRMQERSLFQEEETLKQPSTFVIRKNLNDGPEQTIVLNKNAQLPIPKTVGLESIGEVTITEQKEVIKVNKPKESFENLAISSKDVLPGEILVSSMACSINPIQYPDINCEGLLILTNFKIFFKPRDHDINKKKHLKPDYFSIPLGFISKYEKISDKKNINLVTLDLYSKDGRIFKFRITTGFSAETNQFLQYLPLYFFPEKKEYFFAYEFGKYSELEKKYNGWKVYDIEEEFRRQGIDFEPLNEKRNPGPSSNLYRIVDNRTFKICSTYPQLLLVPGKMSDQAVLSCSRFRSRERFPVITYYYKPKGTIMARSSQSKSGITTNRCLEDEQLLKFLGNPYQNDYNESNGVDLYIYDARPYLSAMGNRLNGKGFEDTKNYRNCEIQFMDIENIHHVRESHRKLLNLCFSPEHQNNRWLAQLESSGWLEILSFIINAALKVSTSLKAGKNCLVHCSDGWDRTAQILSLTQIFLDPHFRTIEGFEMLVEKEWVSFGHQFLLRMGHGNKNDKDDQRAPVFLQYLDCIHQIMNQYPYAFEFNDKFLMDIAYHSYSCQFGNFLCNTSQESLMYKIPSLTVSIWSYINSQKEKYLNPYYKKHTDADGSIKPSAHLKHLRLWEEFYLNFSFLSRPQFKMDNVEFHREYFQEMYIKEKNRAKGLEEEVAELKRKLAELQGGSPILEFQKSDEDQKIENNSNEDEDEEFSKNQSNAKLESTPVDDEQTEKLDREDD